MKSLASQKDGCSMGGPGGATEICKLAQYDASTGAGGFHHTNDASVGMKMFRHSKVACTEEESSHAHPLNGLCGGHLAQGGLALAAAAVGSAAGCCPGWPTSRGNARLSRTPLVAQQ
eukprot:657688-Pelagomonas_calceolata.AAC.7